MAPAEQMHIYKARSADHLGNMTKDDVERVNKNISPARITQLRVARFLIFILQDQRQHSVLEGSIKAATQVLLILQLSLLALLVQKYTY